MYEQIEKNKRKSLILMLGFIFFVIFLGWVFGELTRFGSFAILIAVIIAFISVWSSYYYSDRFVLAISGARPVEKAEFPYLYNVVEGLTIAAGIPKPKLYVIDSPALNAFATGRDPEHSAIAVTSGLLKKLDRLELEGVIAHEMSHIKNYDIRLGTLAVVMVGIIAFLSDWLMRSFLWGGFNDDNRDRGALGPILVIIGLIMAILAPLIAQIIRLAISREREFLADASGALLTRYPEGLANALEKISQESVPLRTANNATAHLFIVNPFKNFGRRISSLFDTHPPIEERIKRLREM